MFPKHYNAQEEETALGFKPAGLTLDQVVNGGCNFDHRGRRQRAVLVGAAGLVVLALATRPIRARWVLLLPVAVAAVLVLGGLPGLFGGG